jgi:peptidoglycan/LPS O-acetylase OafA/YrhL
VEGLALGAMYALLLCRPGFVQAKKTRAAVAVLFVVFYVWQTYAPAQLRLPWLLPFGGDDILIWLLIFGLAQELWPLKLLGNRAVQFCASRVMTVYLVHQAWFMYVDELRDGLVRRQIYSITSGQRAVIRLVGTLVLAELLHSVLPRVLEACKTKVKICMQKRKEPADGGETECTQKS